MIVQGNHRNRDVLVEYEVIPPEQKIVDSKWLAIGPVNALPEVQSVLGPVIAQVPGRQKVRPIARHVSFPDYPVLRQECLAPPVGTCADYDHAPSPTVSAYLFNRVQH